MPADDTDTPTADTPTAGKTAAKPRRQRTPRAKDAEAFKSATTAGASAATPADTAKPRRTPRAKAGATPKGDAAAGAPATPAAEPGTSGGTPAKPATRRVPARKTASRSTSRTAAPRAVASRRKEDSSASGWQALAPIAGAAGVGVAVGVLAMLGRKAAVQAPTAMAHDWATALAAEHKAVLGLFDRLESTEPGATARRTALLSQLKQLLARHALQEENVVYPALRQKGWRAEADDLTARAALVKTWLYELGNSPAASADWIATLRTFRTGFEEQAGIEDKLFPALRGELTAEQNKTLAASMNKEGFKLA